MCYSLNELRLAFWTGSAEKPKRGGLQVRPSELTELENVDWFALALDESPTRALARVRRFFVLSAPATL